MFRKIRKKVYDNLELTEDSGRFAIFLNIFIIVLIILSVLSLIIGSIPALANYEIFIVIELLSIVVFTIEYILRFWSCVENKKYHNPFTGRLRYATTPLAIIDLLAIIPFYLPFIFPIDLLFLRVLRLFRIFRVFKLARYTQSFAILSRVLKKEKESLVITFFLLIVTLIISSSLMYYAEKDVQPEVFGSIPNSMWWAVASLTTVGYGDVYPVTAMGRFMAGFIVLLGIGFVALPTAIMSSGYINELKRTNSESMANTITDLERITSLKEKGTLNPDEFDDLKNRILNN